MPPYLQITQRPPNLTVCTSFQRSSGLEVDCQQGSLEAYSQYMGCTNSGDTQCLMLAGGRACLKNILVVPLECNNEKIATVMCVCPRYVIHVLYSCTCTCTYVRVYMWLTSAHTCVPTLTMTFNIDDHFHLEMIVNINVITLERVLADSIEKSSRQSSEDMFRDEIVQEIKEQLGPSYNSLSL